jgi:hypothetical protein
MAQEGQLGFRKAYKQTGKPGNAVAPGAGTTNANSGKSGSQRAISQVKEGNRKNVHN